eukprot:maker-scaffold_8-snap-gene-12.57-mRNA-1 protein AED:0.00 eAED:0.00 QI:52/1/1/1/1/1/2/156/445
MASLLKKRSKKQCNVKIVKKAKKKSSSEVEECKIYPKIRLDTETALMLDGFQEVETIEINTEEDFLMFMSKTTKKILKTKDKWLRQPDTPWILELWTELNAEQKRKALEDLEMLKKKNLNNFPKETAGQIYNIKWDLRQQFAYKVILHWFNQCVNYEQVYDKSKSLGQFKIPFGYRLRGKFIEENFSRQRNCSVESLKKDISCIASEVDVHQVLPKSAFLVEAKRIKVEEICKMKSSGSLNTKFNYRQNLRSNFDALDQYYRSFENIFIDPEEDEDPKQSIQGFLELNHYLFYIWKFQNYNTAYHQDVHTFPHYTFYSQYSGISVFHFLPPLIGIFFSRCFKAEANNLKLLKMFKDFKSYNKQTGRRIGSLATLQPGEVLLICPSGAHGVFVPDLQDGFNQKLEKSVKPFEISSILAAEVFFKKINSDLKKKFRGEGWLKFPVPK